MKSTITKKDFVQKLLSKDINTFSQFLPEIRSFSKDDIENLWNGNIDYNYPSHKVPLQGSFKLLVVKFANFLMINDEYYQDQENHSFLIDLWKKYLSVTKLKKLEENERIQKLEKEKIRLPKNFDFNLFNQIIDNTSHEYKKILDEECSKKDGWFEYLKALFALKQMVKDTKLEQEGIDLGKFLKYGIIAIILISLPVSCHLYKPEMYEYLKRRIMKNIDTSKKYIDIFKKVVNKKFVLESQMIVWANFILAGANCFCAVAQFINIKRCYNKTNIFNEEYLKILNSFNTNKKKFNDLNKIIVDEMKQWIVKEHLQELLKLQESFKKNLEDLSNLINRIEKENDELKSSQFYAKCFIGVGCLTLVIGVLGVITGGTALIVLPSIGGVVLGGVGAGFGIYNHYSLGNRIDQNEKIIQDSKALKKDLEDTIETNRNIIEKQLKENKDALPDEYRIVIEYYLKQQENVNM